MPDKLLFSFHGVPKRYIKNQSDPYVDQCRRTARLVAKTLRLGASSWEVAFQSRFGPEEWVQPYTDRTLENWACEGVNSVHVISPGFSADCLETLDEIDREAREIFEQQGGKHFYYIPALNNRPDHIAMLVEIVLQRLQCWQSPQPVPSVGSLQLTRAENS